MKTEKFSYTPKKQRNYVHFFALAFKRGRFKKALFVYEYLLILIQIIKGFFFQRTF